MGLEKDVGDDAARCKIGLSENRSYVTCAASRANSMLFSLSRLPYKLYVLPQRQQETTAPRPQLQGMGNNEDAMTRNNHDADVTFIKALAELLNANDLTELQVKREYGEDDSLEVRVVKQATVIAAPAQVSVAAPVSAPVAAMAPAPAATSPVAAIEDPSQHPGALISPMVGTAYLAAEPGAAPFVVVGTQVSEGQTVMIIEAMKTMNHIPAPKSGTIKRILISDGSPVEYGAPLMIIE
jgi:acetyl-CoA carboxylase biotin carboxyl carrier protein